jgi:hypothetical protein
MGTTTRIEKAILKAAERERESNAGYIYIHHIPIP